MLIPWSFTNGDLMDHQTRAILRSTGITLIVIWIGAVIYAYLYAISGLLTLRDYVFNPWGRIGYITLYVWTPWILIVPLVILLAHKIPLKPEAWISGTLKHLGLMILVSLVHGYISARLYYWIGDMTAEMGTYQPWQHTGHLLFQDNIFLLDAFIYASLIASQNIRLFYHLASRNEMKALHIKNQLNESRLQALKMQINPHFLFNTLNSISVLIRKDEIKLADQMIAHLSDFFRTTLEQGSEQLIPLEQEINLIRQYIEIEKIRFGERLQVDIEIEKDISQQPVPVLLLQPLVENAIRHGLSKKTGPCLLKLHVTREADHLLLEIQDNGIGVETVSESRGIGLRNVKERLLTLYESRFQFRFESLPGQGTSVSIRLPFVDAGSSA